MEKVNADVGGSGFTADISFIGLLISSWNDSRPERIDCE